MDKESMKNHVELVNDYYRLWIMFKNAMGDTCEPGDYARLFIGYLQTYHWSVQSTLPNETTHKIVIDDCLKEIKE